MLLPGCRRASGLPLVCMSHAAREPGPVTTARVSCLSLAGRPLNINGQLGCVLGTFWDQFSVRKDESRLVDGGQCMSSRVKTCYIIGSETRCFLVRMIVYIPRKHKTWFSSDLSSALSLSLPLSPEGHGRWCTSQSLNWVSVSRDSST